MKVGSSILVGLGSALPVGLNKLNVLISKGPILRGVLDLCYNCDADNNAGVQVDVRVLR